MSQDTPPPHPPTQINTALLLWGPAHPGGGDVNTVDWVLKSSPSGSLSLSGVRGGLKSLDTCVGVGAEGGFVAGVPGGLCNPQCVLTPPHPTPEPRGGVQGDRPSLPIIDRSGDKEPFAAPPWRPPAGKTRAMLEPRSRRLAAFHSRPPSTSRSPSLSALLFSLPVLSHALFHFPLSIFHNPLALSAHISGQYCIVSDMTHSSIFYFVSCAVNIHNCVWRVKVFCCCFFWD